LKEEKKLVRVIGGESVSPPPIWLMRQAGRYLPEYRALRAKAGSFWAMCMNPQMACEITLQPIERFGFDAAIIFSDILVVPAALGVKVEFEENVGPVLPPISDVAGLGTDQSKWDRTLAPVYEVLRLTHAKLDSDTALIGFAGAPWTLATYMAQGRGSPDQRAAKLWFYRDPESFTRLLDLLGDCVAHHLARQIEAGADVVQIFDSWASGLPERMFEACVIVPTKRVVRKLRAIHPNAKIIGFPRAATLDGYERYACETGVDAISLDTSVPMRWASEKLGVAIQGNLDPIALLAGGDALKQAADDILHATRGRPFIFNLGHGVLQETPPEHVAELIARVRAS
jgi:uroporphyrinogen decarboxylase